MHVCCQLLVHELLLSRSALPVLYTATVTNKWHCDLIVGLLWVPQRTSHSFHGTRARLPPEAATRHRASTRTPPDVTPPTA